MLFWIFVILLIGSIVWFCCTDAWKDLLRFCIGMLISILGVAVLVSVILFGVNYIGADATVDQLNVRYEMLVYQYENDIYENDNDLGKRDLMVNIQAWNEDLARQSTIQDDFWVGIYYPNIYDQFKPIELK